MALPAAEDFVGAAGALPGEWTQQKTTVTLNLDGSGNAVSSAGSDEGFAYWNADLPNPDQIVKAIIAVVNSLTGYAQVSCRCSTDVGNAAWDGYLGLTDGGSGLTHTEVGVVIDGVYNVLKGIASSFVAGDEIGFSADGVTLTLFRNGAQIDTATDSTWTGGYGGAGAFGSGKLDSWSVDNLTEPLSITRNRKLATQQRMVA